MNQGNYDLNALEGCLNEDPFLKQSLFDWWERKNLYLSIIPIFNVYMKDGDDDDDAVNLCPVISSYYERG